jgi:hypothetical protein
VCHGFLRLASFWTFLSLLDRDLAEKVHEEGCPCGGALHSARYPRKPRGGPEGLPEDYGYRWSFCCAREGCRKRSTPPSVRFIGRQVYLGALVVLVTAMRQGATPHGARQLKAFFGVDRTTIARWQRFWQETFPRSVFWRVARARFLSALSVATLPLDLLEAFRREAGTWREALQHLLRFLSPITTRKSLDAQPF